MYLQTENININIKIWLFIQLKIKRFFPSFDGFTATHFSTINFEENKRIVFSKNDVIFREDIEVIYLLP